MYAWTRAECVEAKRRVSGGCESNGESALSELEQGKQEMSSDLSEAI